MSKINKIDEAFEDAKLLAMYATRKAMALRVGKVLPRGAKKEIAKLSGVSEITVYKFFTGELETEAVYQGLTDYLVCVRQKTEKLAKEAGLNMDEIYKNVTLLKKGK